MSMDRNRTDTSADEPELVRAEHGQLEKRALEAFRGQRYRGPAPDFEALHEARSSAATTGIPGLRSLRGWGKAPWPHRLWVVSTAVAAVILISVVGLRSFSGAFPYLVTSPIASNPEEPPVAAAEPSKVADRLAEVDARSRRPAWAGLGEEPSRVEPEVAAEQPSTLSDPQSEDGGARSGTMAPNTEPERQPPSSAEAPRPSADPAPAESPAADAIRSEESALRVPSSRSPSAALGALHRYTSKIRKPALPRRPRSLPSRLPARPSETRAMGDQVGSGAAR